MTEFRALLWQQLNNDFIGGSLALAVASALVGFVWRLVYFIHSWAGAYTRSFLSST